MKPGTGRGTAPSLAGPFPRASSKEFAFEELVAELTSAYLCARFEMRAKLRHAKYLSHYLKIMKDDAAAFFRAAAAAQRATDYLGAFTQELEEAA